MSSSSKVRLGLTVAVAATVGAVVFGVLPAIAQDGLEEAISSETSDVEEVESEDESTESESEDSTDDSTGAPEDTFGAWVSDRAHELGKDGDGRTFGSETSAAARAQHDDDAVDESDESDESGSGEESAEESGGPNGNGAGNGNGHSNSGKND